MRRVELNELIRHDFFDFNKSKREIARSRGVHRRVVRQAIKDPTPPERKTPVRISPVMTDEVKAFIDKILTDDHKAPKKQRHTAHRIWQRVREELGSKAAESTVRSYVADRKKELGTAQVFILQHHRPGQQGEADFYEADFEFPWGPETAQIMVLRSEYSAGSLHVAFPRRQTQSAMFDAIERGCRFFVVFNRIRFDNLTLAVAKVLKGSRRIEQDRFIAFRSHLMFVILHHPRD